MLHDQLQRNALALRDAAEREDWETVTLLLAKIDEEARKHIFRAADKATITSTLGLLTEAMQRTVKRRDEIRNLVNKLGSAPV